MGRYALPGIDMMALADAALRHPGLGWLLEPHNGSPAIAVKLLVLADLRLFGGSLALHTAIALIASVGAFVVVAAGLDRTAHPMRPLSAAATGLLAIIWFRTVTLEPYVIASGAGYLLLLLGAVACLGLAASIGPREPCFARTMFAALFGLLAAGSLASGLLVLPLAAWILRRRSDQEWPAAMLAALAILAIAVYAANGRVEEGALSWHPLGLLRFMAILFGSPWVKVNAIAGEAAGYWTIALCLAVAIAGLLPRAVDGSGSYAGGLAAFALGAALMAAIGRLPQGLEQATAGRYGILTIVAYAALILAAVRQSRLRRGIVSPMTAVGLVMVTGLLLAEQIVIGRRYTARADTVEAAATTVRRGEIDPEALRPIYGDGEYAAALLRRLAEAGLYGLKEKGR